MKITSENTFKFISLFPHTRRNAIERHTQIHKRWLRSLLSLGKFQYVCMYVHMLYIYVPVLPCCTIKMRK